MKYLQKFEEIHKDDKFHYNGIYYPGGAGGPHVGDYVIVKNFKNDDEIGKILAVDQESPFNVFRVDDAGTKYWFEGHEILHYAKTKEELEIFIDTKKYNL